MWNEKGTKKYAESDAYVKIEYVPAEVDYF